MGFDDIPSKTILVVDDDRTVRTLVGVFLKRAGFSVLTASDGAEAVSIFRQHQQKIALMLTDVTMPTMDGLQLADAVLTLCPWLPVIFISGNIPNADRGYGCIAKPFTMDEIIGRVRQVLAAKEPTALRQRPNTILRKTRSGTVKNWIS